MFRAPALALASFLVFASPAIAQRSAPITQGVTSTDLASQVSAARQQTAEVKVQVNGLTGDVMQLTGRVETLEFQLQQAREENELLQRDNEALITEIDELRADQEQQSAMMASMQAYLSSAGIMPEAEPASPQEDADSYGYPGAEDAGAFTNASPGMDGTVRMSLPDQTNGSGPRRIVATSEPSDNALTGLGSTAARSDQLPMNANDALPEGSLGTLPASALPGQAGPLFAMAKSKLIQFDYAGAEEAFRAFLEQFGDDPQAGEAQYWLGEVLYQQKAYADSGAAYTTMIRSFPDDPRAPDALVKLARAMRLIGDKEKACLALDNLPKRYPTTSGVTRDLAAVERTKSGCDN